MVGLQYPDDTSCVHACTRMLASSRAIVHSTAQQESIGAGVDCPSLLPPSPSTDYCDFTQSVLHHFAVEGWNGSQLVVASRVHLGVHIPFQFLYSQQAASDFLQISQGAARPVATALI